MELNKVPDSMLVESYVKNSDKNVPNGVAGVTNQGVIPLYLIPTSRLGSLGIVALEDSVTSSDNMNAATPNSVKTAYDLAAKFNKSVDVPANADFNDYKNEGFFSGTSYSGISNKPLVAFPSVSKFWLRVYTTSNAVMQACHVFDGTNVIRSFNRGYDTPNTTWGSWTEEINSTSLATGSVAGIAKISTNISNSNDIATPLSIISKLGMYGDSTTQICTVDISSATDLNSLSGTFVKRITGTLTNAPASISGLYCVLDQKYMDNANILQTLTTFEVGLSRTYTRSKYFGTWGSWNASDWTLLTMANGFVDYISGQRQLAYRVDGRHVSITGSIKNTTNSTSAIITPAIPALYRPKQDLSFTCPSSGGVVELVVSAAGNLNIVNWLTGNFAYVHVNLTYPIG